MSDSKHVSVLVTGGTGYVGSWTVSELLRRGYEVRTTVRRMGQAADLRNVVAPSDVLRQRFTVTAADLSHDAGWNEAMEGVDTVFHIASPMPIREYRKTDLIGPARDGTLRVLQAATRAGVRRVVMMSSVQAALPDPGHPDGTPSDETTWTDLERRASNDYTRSKTIAERAAWEFAHAAGGRPELTTILPGSVQGPVLQTAVSGSVELVQRLLQGAIPALPRIGFAIVDVRDLVDIQIRAMLTPEAAGKRFIASGDFLWMRDIASILRDECGSAATRVPTRTLPDLVVRAAALFDFEARFMAPNLGRRQVFSSVLAQTLLGAHLRPARETIVDGARSLIAFGAI